MRPHPAWQCHVILCREEDRWAAKRDAPGAEAGRSREYSAYRQQAPNGGSSQERGPSRGGWDSGGAQAGGYGREPPQASAGRNGVPRLPLDDEFPGLNMGQQVRAPGISLLSYCALPICCYSHHQTSCAPLLCLIPQSKVGVMLQQLVLCLLSFSNKVAG